MDFGWTLMNHAVLQRNAAGFSEYAFGGTAGHDGEIRLSARDSAGKVVADLVVGRARKGTASGVLTGLPVGGPYTLELSVVADDGKCFEKVRFSDILVGDLWILAGQSNMEGAGYLPGLTPSHPMIHNFYMDNRWDMAKDPLHNLFQAAAPVHGGNPKNKPQKILRGVGPGMSFAEGMWKATGVPQGLIACAHGGTSMAQWDPALRDKGGWSLYGAMYERFRHLGGRVAGVLWSQGCDDANPVNSPLYEQHMRDFLAALRRDLGNPRLPVVLAQIGPHVNQKAFAEDWSRVRFAQYEIGRTTKYTCCVPGIDLPLDDWIHLSAASQRIMGQRMASAMQYLLKMPGSVAPIEAVRTSVVPDPATGNANVTVTFRNVVGKLLAHGEPSGFFTPLVGEMPGEGCFKVELKGKQAVVHTSIPALEASKHLLAYGAGLRPYANLTDEAGRAVPCFTLPMKFEEKGATALVSEAEVSDPVYGPEAVETLALPENPEKLTWQKAKFTEFFLEHPRRKELATTDAKVFYFRFRMEAPEAMELKVKCGSDGPIALFCDGRAVDRVFTINPLIVDEFAWKAKVEKGIHEWCFAMSSNTGHAWGVCCRFVRKGAGPLPILKAMH